MVVEKRTWGGTVVRWLPPLVWMGIIFFVSGQAKTDVPSFGGWDLLVKKGGHFLAYALLAWLLLRAMGEAERPYLSAFIITVLYAVSDEFHQTFVPGRGGRLPDVLIDALGGLTALLVCHRRAMGK